MKGNEPERSPKYLPLPEHSIASVGKTRYPQHWWLYHMAIIDTCGFLLEVRKHQKIQSTLLRKFNQVALRNHFCSHLQRLSSTFKPPPHRKKRLIMLQKKPSALLWQCSRSEPHIENKIHCYRKFLTSGTLTFFSLEHRISEVEQCYYLFFMSAALYFTQRRSS